MLGMLSSVVAAAGTIERAGAGLSGLSTGSSVWPVRRWSRLAPQMPEWQCGPVPRNLERCANRSAHRAGHVKYGGLPASAARVADPGVVDWQASNPDKFGDKLIFAIGTKRRL